MNFMRQVLVLLAAAAACLTAQAQTTPADDPDALFKGKMGGTFGKDMIEVLPAARRVAIPALRVAFVTENTVTAQVRASYLPGRDTSGARSSLQVKLSGVSPRTLQAITDRVYAELVAEIASSGREVVPPEQMQEFFTVVNASPSDAAQPYIKESGGQTVSVFAPTGMPLVFTHFDRPWGDRGSFDLNNYRRLEEYSGKWEAAVVMPLIVVNFARMQSSGNQSGLVARSAETGAQMSMSVAQLQGFYARTTEFRNGMAMGGDQGSFNLVKAVESELAFGSMKETEQSDNAASKGLFDSIGRLAGLANAGGAARNSSRAVAESSDDAYAAAAGDALRRMAASLGDWFRKYPPAK